MAFRIVWSNAANQDIRSITKRIKLNWSQKSAEKFQFVLFKKVDTLLPNPERGRASQKAPQYRLLKIDKHNFLIYEIVEDEIHIHNVLPYKMDHSADFRF